MGSLSPEQISSFRSTIMEYFRAEGRSFPWRETRDPYRILVSEIMLQQTQTDRVVPKYLSWLEAFPTVQSLAEAPFSAVLEHWIGLGYNRRARFLQEACRAVMELHGGIIPADPDTLDALPGIGPYTARAVSTFAFGIPNVFIETNIRAVYIFFFFRDRTDVADSEILALIGETLDGDDPRSWYYALMDYGSALKRTVSNPNRASRHYTRQSRFEGSLRQARGAVLRYLSENGEGRAIEISAASGLGEQRVSDAITALASEGMVREEAGVYRIS